MNDSVRKWINGKAKTATFTVDRVATGHRAHRSGCGAHDGMGRKRTRNDAFRREMRSQDQ